MMPEKASRALLKLARALDRAPERREHGLFKAEGSKCVADLAERFNPVHVIATAAWAEANPGIATALAPPAEMERITSLSTAPDVIALMRMPAPQEMPAPAQPGALTLCLDTIQDPGNLGTIIRTADWMGIDRIVCSRDTADCFAPKTVRSTMGSLARVSIEYAADLPAWLAKSGVAVCGTFLGGDNLYATELPREGAVLVIGNEGHGISAAVEALCDKRLTIPRMREGAESLNAAVAAALVMAKFRLG